MQYRAFILGLIIFSPPSVLLALEPLEAVRQNIERGISVLEDPQYEDDSRKQEQQQILWEIMQQTYDFKEFSRKVLASHWYKFSPAQRSEFVRVFSEFLGKFYLEKGERSLNAAHDKPQRAMEGIRSECSGNQCREQLPGPVKINSQQRIAQANHRPAQRQDRGVG